MNRRGFIGTIGAVVAAPVALRHDAQPLPMPISTPAVEEALNDPWYRHRCQEGLNAIQRSTEARGVLLTLATAKSIADYEQRIAAEAWIS